MSSAGLASPAGGVPVGRVSAVKQFCEAHREEVEFYLWLQWLARRQFAACWDTCQSFKLPIGLYRDLAVGVAAGGAETPCDRELYCLKASVGAAGYPRPARSELGLPPMDPHIIVARAYEPFIDLLRANMQNCGALRIDHVMSLLRLWWIPYGETADRGAYVQYPVDDLVGYSGAGEPTSPLYGDRRRSGDCAS
ncbi:4-alpha-glucanotransferase [Serratia ureilytica]